MERGCYRATVNVAVELPISYRAKLTEISSTLNLSNKILTLGGQWQLWRDGMAAMGPELALVEPFVGYGKIVTLAPKNKEAADNLRALVAATAMPPGPEFVSVLAPADPKVLVVVEIRKTPCRVSGFYDQAADQLSAAPAVELFGDARQWARPTKFVNPKVGVFVRQRARNGADLGALRDAQAAAYSRQMTLEDPGCATCAILSDVQRCSAGSEQIVRKTSSSIAPRRRVRFPSAVLAASG